MIYFIISNIIDIWALAEIRGTFSGRHSGGMKKTVPAPYNWTGFQDKNHDEIIESNMWEGISSRPYIM